MIFRLCRRVVIWLRSFLNEHGPDLFRLPPSPRDRGHFLYNGSWPFREGKDGPPTRILSNCCNRVRWAPSDGIDFRRDRKNYSRRCEAHQMTAWKTMESAPKDGTEVLLVARFQIYGGDGTISRVVGAWNEHVQQWRLSPEFLDNGEYLSNSKMSSWPSGAGPVRGSGVRPRDSRTRRWSAGGPT